MMDVTFVLEESGVTATVEVPCEADVAAAKEVACTALAVSPASVEMRIGTQVLEGTCRLQDTAFDAGVQVVLACPRFADIKCPAKNSVCDNIQGIVQNVSLSPCGTLCLIVTEDEGFSCVGFDTETFNTAFKFEIEDYGFGPGPAISRCKTHCYLAGVDHLLKLALPGGEELRKVDRLSRAVFACGGVVVSRHKDGISVYDEDLTLLRSLSHEWCRKAAVSDCGGWVITSSEIGCNAYLWDVNTGEAVACVPAGGLCQVALSRRASVFAVEGQNDNVQLYDWSGAALRSVDVGDGIESIQFTPCGKYLVVNISYMVSDYDWNDDLHQYDVANTSCVRVIKNISGSSFAISPCSRVVVFGDGSSIVTRHLYPHNSE